MTAAYGTAGSRAPSKREVRMNNPGEAPLYPDSPDDTNSETALNYCSPAGNELEDQCYYS
jgi:hypothetical protein